MKFLLKSLSIIVLLVSLKGNGQDLFNVLYDNPFLENGGGVGLSVFHTNEKTHVIGGVVAENSQGVGLELVYSSEGQLLSTWKLASPITEENVILGRYGGADFNVIKQKFLIPYTEFYSDSLGVHHDNALISYSSGSDTVFMIHDEMDEFDYNFYLARDYGDYLMVAGQVNHDTAFYLSADGAHGFLMKLDTLGNQEWVQNYEQSVEINFIDQNSQGEFILGSWDHSAEPFPISSEHLIIKTDAMGNEQWRYTFGGLESQSSPPLFFNENDEVIAAAWKHDFDNGYFPLRFLKIKDFGNSFEVLSDIEFHGNTSHGKITYAVKESSIGEVYASGHLVYPHSNGIGIQPAGFLMKMNSDLDSLWLRHYNFYTYSSAVESIKDFNFTEDGGLVMVGESKESLLPDEANIPGLTHIWTLKVDEHGCLEPGCELVGAEEILVGLQDAMKVYPNPVQDVLNLQWNLPLHFNENDFQNQRLVIINSMGQIVHTKNITRGYLLSNYPMNISTLPSGHYTLHWMSDNKWLDSVKFIKE